MGARDLPNLRVTLLLLTGALCPCPSGATAVLDGRSSPVVRFSHVVMRQPALDQAAFIHVDRVLPELATLQAAASQREREGVSLLALEQWTERLEQPTRVSATSSESPVPLPEPGPMSAIIATLSLAAFAFVRRFV